VIAALLTAPWWLRTVGTARGTERGRRAAMAAALVVAPYLVVGNVFVLNRGGFAERLLYVPALGLCMLVGLGFAAAVEAGRTHLGTRGPAAAYAILAGVVAAATLHARDQNRLWSDDETFLVTNLEVHPESLRSRFTLAALRMDQGRDDEALEHYETAIEYAPRHGASWMYAALLRARGGDLPGAERAIRRAAALRPDVAEAQLWLGAILSARGYTAEAERAFRRSLLLYPRNVEAARRLADLLFAQRRYEEAAKLYRDCLELGLSGVEDRLRAAERRMRRGGHDVPDRAGPRQTSPSK
jgi:tetratricopeptide (TPR) repeat protein